jgi:hypothetical protein
MSETYAIRLLGGILQIHRVIEDEISQYTKSAKGNVHMSERDIERLISRGGEKMGQVGIEPTTDTIQAIDS